MIIKELQNIINQSTESASILIGDSSPIFNYNDFWMLAESIWLYDTIYISENILKNSNNIYSILTNIDGLNVISISPQEINNTIRNEIIKRENKTISINESLEWESPLIDELMEELNIKKSNRRAFKESIFFPFPLLQRFRFKREGYYILKTDVHKHFFDSLKISRTWVYSDFLLSQLLNSTCIPSYSILEQATAKALYRCSNKHKYTKILNLESFDAEKVGAIDLKIDYHKKEPNKLLMADPKVMTIKSIQKRKAFNYSILSIEDIFKFRTHPALQNFRNKINEITSATEISEDSINNLNNEIDDFFLTDFKKLSKINALETVGIISGVISVVTLGLTALISSITGLVMDTTSAAPKVYKKTKWGRKEWQYFVIDLHKKIKKNDKP